MVKKIILEVDCDSTQSSTTLSRQDLINSNEEMHKIVTKYKNKITPFYHNKTWDKFKKLSNEYELIFTTPNTKSNISNYSPVSRSFFKMWEMLHDFTDDVFRTQSTEQGLKCMFLAEGPGGFLEAMMKYRNNPNDKYYGMTLRPVNKSVPEWKLKKFETSNVSLLYGEDNSGDLYNVNNTHFIANQIGKQTIDVITADGGFDFSSDFNNQEDLSIKLIRCETYCAFHLLKDNGTFILKIYDMFHHNTLGLLQILKCCFKKICFIKPLTSRPANSEKYILCSGFKAEEGQQNIPILHNLITKRSASPSRSFTYQQIDIELLHKIVLYNMFYTCRQVYYIQKTIDFINKFDTIPFTQRTQIHEDVVNKNNSKCIKWCNKYKIPISS